VFDGILDGTMEQKKTLAVPLAKVFLAFAQKEREIFSFVKSLVL